MEFKTKKFCELTAAEIYEILKSRSEIFLLEQKIICQDMDNVDYDSLHCFFEENGRALAYLRAYLCPDDTSVVKIGRVLTLNHGKGFGKALCEQSFPEIKRAFPGCTKIRLNAQKTAEGFYEKLGFETVSGEFLEEGVVHVAMELNL